MKIFLIDFENVKSKGLTGIDSLTEQDKVIIFYSENADTISFDMHQKVLTSKSDIEYFKVHVGGKNALDFQLSTLLGYLVAKNFYSHIYVISNDKSFDFLHDFWNGKYVSAPKCVVYRTRTIAQAISYTQGLVDDNDDIAEEPAEVEAAEIIQETVKTQQEAAPVEAQQTETADQIKAEEQAQPVQETEPAQETAASEPQAEKQEKKRSTKAAKVQDYSSTLAASLRKLKCDKKTVETVGELLAGSDTKEEFHNSLAKEFKQSATDLYKVLRPKYLRLKEMYLEEHPEAVVEVPDAPAPVEEPEQTAPETAAPANEDRLAQLLEGICTEEELGVISQLFDEAPTKQQLYIRMVKQFRKSKGCKFYNAIKNEYDAVAKARAEQ